MKKVLPFIIMFIAAVIAPAALPAAQSSDKEASEAYIRKWAPMAVNEMRRSGVPASITLAQGLVESNAGRSALAVKGNNHFGIKCHNTWKGAKIHFDDDAKGECFRKYPRAEDSFRDHSDFLRYRDRYKFLFDLKPTDYRGWAYGLKKAGYATDPTYPAKLISVIERYGLSKYDTRKGRKDKAEDVPQSPTVLEQPVLVEDSMGYPEFSFSLSRKMFSQNGVPFIYAAEGDTYAMLAKRYNLFVRELMKFNDAVSDSLVPGEPVYIQPKKNKAAKGVQKHIVEDGETLRDISQRYAVKLGRLMKMNKLNADAQLRDGDELILRK
ncbi:MAG: glucosaminidase domain-containing protein [Candidatus Cryptobacteroides sp.]